MAKTSESNSSKSSEIQQSIQTKPIRGRRPKEGSKKFLERNSMLASASKSGATGSDSAEASSSESNGNSQLYSHTS